MGDAELQKKETLGVHNLRLVLKHSYAGFCEALANHRPDLVEGAQENLFTKKKGR